MQQQLRENLQYHDAEVQRLRSITNSLQESSEKVKEASGEGAGGKAEASVTEPVQRTSGNDRSSVE